MVREQPQVIQDIFRDRHILVYGCDSIEDYDRLENDTYHRDIEHPAIEGQGSYVMNVAGEGLRAGMSDFRPIEHKQTSTSLGDRPFQPDGIPGMRALAHDIPAMDLYASTYGILTEADQTHDDSPSPLSTETVTVDSGPSMQVETAGLAAVVYVLEGEKYLVVGEPLPAYVGHLNPASCCAFQHFDEFKVDARFRWEGLSLCKGTILFMRPCTPHCSLTLRPTILRRRRFYSKTTLEISCYGVIHSLLGSRTMDSAVHDHIIPYLTSFIDWIPNGPQNHKAEYVEYSKRNPGRHLLLGAVSVFAFALRPRTYRDECGDILPLSAIHNADLLCPSDQARCFTAARFAFVRWILAQAAEYDLSIGYEYGEVPVAPYSSDEDEDYGNSTHERKYDPVWISSRYRAVFCQLVQFARGIVAAHVRRHRRPNLRPIPLALLIDRLTLDFGQFFGHRAEEYLRHQLHEAEGRLNHSTDDKDLRHFLLKTMIAYREPLTSWNPPPIQVGQDRDGPSSPAPWDSSPTAFLDGLRGNEDVRSGRCLFDMARWYAWRDIRESLLPILQINDRTKGFLARHEMVHLYDM